MGRWVQLGMADWDGEWGMGTECSVRSLMISLEPVRSPWFDFLAGEGGKKTERRGETWGRARPEIKEGENPRRATQGTKTRAVGTGGNGNGNGRPFFASGKDHRDHSNHRGTTGAGRQTGEKGEPKKPRNGRQMVSLSFGCESLRLGLSFLPQKLALGHANQPPRRLPRIDSWRIRANRFESRGPRTLINLWNLAAPRRRRWLRGTAVPVSPAPVPPSPAHSPTPTDAIVLDAPQCCESASPAEQVCWASGVHVPVLCVWRVWISIHKCGCAFFFGHTQCRRPPLLRLTFPPFALALRYPAPGHNANYLHCCSVLSRLQPAHRIGVAGGFGWWVWSVVGCRWVRHRIPLTSSPLQK